MYKLKLFICLLLISTSLPIDAAKESSFAVSNPTASPKKADPTSKSIEVNDIMSDDMMEEMVEHASGQRVTEESKVYVEIDGIENADYLANAKAYLDLYDENESYISNPSYIRFLAKKGVEQIKASLQPFGYYQANVKLQFNREGINRRAIYTVELGPALMIDQLNIKIEGEGKDDPDFIKLLKEPKLKEGHRLVQSEYTDLKGKIKSLAATNGYFDGTYATSSIVLDKTLTKAEINLIYNSGIRYEFDDPKITQDFLNDEVFDKYKVIHAGDKFSTSAIADMQRDLYNSGYVKQIDVDSKKNKENKTVAIDFKLTRQKRKKYSLAVGFGTDTGFRMRYDYTWHWVNQSGHRLKSEIFISQNLIDTGLEYRIPARKAATDYFNFFINYKDDNTGDLDSKTYSFGSGYHDKVGNMEREIGLSWQQEKFNLGFDSGDVGTLTPYIQLVYKKSDDPLNTSQGFSFDTFVTGGSENALSDITFLQAVGNAKYIKRIKRHKLTLSGGLGKTYVDDFHKLPSQFRFFTGGDRTIRGYSFEDIGDRDGSGDVIGGDKLYFGSIEYEYFFKPEMSLAAFVDAGDAFSDHSSIKVGAGVGFHYYSPIGPIKVDVAHGFEEPGDKVRLHFTIGADL